MTHDWVLDVLTDLKAFAERNGLMALADQLDDAAMIAAAEIASSEGRLPDRGIDGREARPDHRQFAAGENT
jgi:hypothetical protein